MSLREDTEHCWATRKGEHDPKAQGVPTWAEAAGPCEGEQVVAVGHLPCLAGTWALRDTCRAFFPAAEIALVACHRRRRGGHTQLHCQLPDA